MVKFTLNDTDVPSKETLARINERYAEAEKNNFYDAENPPLTNYELGQIISQVKKRA